MKYRYPLIVIVCVIIVAVVDWYNIPYEEEPETIIIQVADFTDNSADDTKVEPKYRPRFGFVLDSLGTVIGTYWNRVYDSPVTVSGQRGMFTTTSHDSLIANMGFLYSSFDRKIELWYKDELYIFFNMSNAEKWLDKTFQSGISTRMPPKIHYDYQDSIRYVIHEYLQYGEIVFRDTVSRVKIKEFDRVYKAQIADSLSHYIPPPIPFDSLIVPKWRFW